MKNIVSTMIVFGLIFLIIVVGAYVFDKVNGFGLIDKVDTSINNGIQTILDDNKTSENITQQTDNNTENLSLLNSNDNVSDNVSDNNTSLNNEVEDEVATSDNSSAVIDNADETDEINDNTTNSEVNSIESNAVDNETDVTM